MNSKKHKGLKPGPKLGSKRPTGAARPGPKPNVQARTLRVAMRELRRENRHLRSSLKRAVRHLGRSAAALGEA